MVEPIVVRLFGEYCHYPSTFTGSQNYITQGFKRTAGVDFDIVPTHAKVCSALSQRNVRGAHRAWSVFNWLCTRRRSTEADRVGRYNFEIGSKCIKVCIDMADGQGICDKRAYQWSDIYFKANKWSTRGYPANVYPLLNGNGKLDAKKIAQIKQLRSRDKEIDLIFMTKIYPSSRQEVFQNNIEHHVRLFEALAELNCSKYLKAIIPANYKDMMGKYLDRLDHAEVPYSTSWDGMSSMEFWDFLAKARIVFLRPGKHGCISWRMTDLLCMGACIVTDLAPYPKWPVPLVSGVNYFDCGCGMEPDESLPSLELYGNIGQVIENTLSDQAKLDLIAQNNRNYFDEHGTPEHVAAYIIDMVKSWPGSDKLAGGMDCSFSLDSERLPGPAVFNSDQSDQPVEAKS